MEDVSLKGVKNKMSFTPKSLKESPILLNFAVYCPRDMKKLSGEYDLGIFLQEAWVQQQKNEVTFVVRKKRDRELEE